MIYLFIIIIIYLYYISYFCNAKYTNELFLLIFFIFNLQYIQHTVAVNFLINFIIIFFILKKKKFFVFEGFFFFFFFLGSLFLGFTKIQCNYYD
jgi:hypothetical protein